MKTDPKYENWLKTNVFEQKQKGFLWCTCACFIGKPKFRQSPVAFADVAENYAADDIRVTVNQGYLLKFVRKEAFQALFVALDHLGLAEPGLTVRQTLPLVPERIPVILVFRAAQVSRLNWNASYAKNMQI